jgi:hypothetical protein
MFNHILFTLTSEPLVRRIERPGRVACSASMRTAAAATLTLTGTLTCTLTLMFNHILFTLTAAAATRSVWRLAATRLARQLFTSDTCGAEYKPIAELIDPRSLNA